MAKSMTIFIWTLKILITTYIILVILLFFMQSRMLYFPQRSLKNVSAEEIEFTNKNIVLRGWVLNKGNKKAILYYGGNAEKIDKNIAFYRENLPEYTVYLINYRGFGKSDGNPSEKNLFDDALSIYDQISSQYESISLIGRSLGTGIASFVASKRKIDKLVLITPYDSILNVAKQTFWMFPLSILLRDKYESIEYVKNIKARTLLFIAEKDHVIPFQCSNNLANEFDKEIVEIVIIKDSGHNNISHFIEFTESIKSFMSLKNSGSENEKK